MPLGFPQPRLLPYLCALFILAAGGARLSAQIAVTDLSTTFNKVLRADGTLMTDPFNDQQTGQKQADIISFKAGTTGIYLNGAATTTIITSDVAGFMVKSGQISGDAVNTYMMFRLRLADANNAKNYQGSYNMIGIDLTSDGRPDIMAGVDSTGAVPKLDFLKPGTGLNDGPSTTTSASYTTIASLGLVTSGAGATFNYAAAAETYDVVANSKLVNTNLTFAISFANLQQAVRDMGTVNGTNFSTFTVNASTVMSFIVFTTGQDNAFNQDIYGGTISSNSAGSWSSLGASSANYTATGAYQPIPEASTFVHIFIVLSGVGLIRHLRSRRRHSPTISATVP